MTYLLSRSTSGLLMMAAALAKEINLPVVKAFLKDPIIPIIEGDWIYAGGTTPGADDASAFDGSLLKGKNSMNLDSEEEGVFTVSCAAADVDTTIPAARQSAGGDCSTYKLSVSGLMGGHSGLEIDKGHGNANVLMGNYR